MSLLKSNFWMFPRKLGALLMSQLRQPRFSYNVSLWNLMIKSREVDKLVSRLICFECQMILSHQMDRKTEIFFDDWKIYSYNKNKSAVNDFALVDVKISSRKREQVWNMEHTNILKHRSKNNSNGRNLACRRVMVDLARIIPITGHIIYTI